MEVGLLSRIDVPLRCSAGLAPPEAAGGSPSSLWGR